MSVYLMGKMFVGPDQTDDTRQRLYRLARELDLGISFDSTWMKTTNSYR